ncbi:MAG: sugar phosphate isomerase/epimerase family protein [Kiritimatiellia bacterium]|jgi:L-ribulose-5-phosphate 3-epimerase
MSETPVKNAIGVMSGLKPDGSSIDVVSDFGLSCCQVVSWTPAHCKPEYARATRQRAADNGVRITAFWAGVPGPAHWNFTHGPITLGLVPPEFRWARIEALQRWADFAVELGAPAIVTHCGFLPENMTDPEFEPTCIAIDQVARYCKDRGLGFWFETGQETPVTLLRYIETVGLDNLGINLDPANLLMYGRGNPIDALEVFGKHVRCVHAKDGCVPTNGAHLGPEVKVGDGMVRYPEFVRRLLDIGFDGDFIIEREISGEQQKKDIAETVRYLEKLLSEAERPKA